MPAQHLVRSWSNGLLLSAAEQFLRALPEALFVQPNRFAGENLGTATEGAAGIHRVSVFQLARDLAQPGMARKNLTPISQLGLEALGAQVAFRLHQEGELEHFDPVSRLPGFGKALARTLGELRLARVSPQQLARSKAPSADLAKLLEAYQHELAERSLVDPAGILELAAAAARHNRHRWLELPVVLLDVPLDSESHRELIRRLIARAPSALIAQNKGQRITEERSSTEPPDELFVALEAKDLDGGPVTGSPALHHLRKNLFAATPQRFEPEDSAAPSFEYFSAPGEGLEAVEIARRILRLARDGTPFDRIAILLRNPDRYQPMVEDALRRAAIPAYFSRGTTRPDPTGRAFLSLLICKSENLSASRFAEYLSLGQVPPHAATAPSEWIAPEDELLAPGPGPAATQPEPPDEPGDPEAPVAAGSLRAPWGWERMLVDAAVIGGRGRWQRRLDGLAREWALQLAEDDSDSQRLRLAQLENLRHFALPLIELLDELPGSATWGDWITRLGELARRSLRSPEGVLAVLAELVPMSDVGPVSLGEAIEVLSERLRFLRREPPQRRWGRVFVASIEEARGAGFAAVFLPGLAEGLFPQRALEDPLLLDELRAAVDSALPLRDDAAHQERLRLHLATACARDHLIVSYPSMEVTEARPRVPSFYALELPRALEGSLPELKQFERLARQAAPARLNWPAPRDAVDAIDDAEYDLVAIAGARDQAGPKQGGAHYLVEQSPTLARSLRTRWRRWAPPWRPADGLITEEPAALAALEENRLKARPWSPSSLEQFAICPYRFALRSIFHLRPREDAEPLQQLDPRTRGLVFHAIQCALYKSLKDDGLLPVNVDNLPDVLARSDTILARVTDRFRDELAPAIPRVWESEIADLRTDLRGWLHHAAHNDYDWRPIEFELPFGKDEPLALAEGVLLRGQIDVVERHVETGDLRVTDHKTGKRPDVIPRWVGGGKSLQPLLYGLAAGKLLQGAVATGRLLYATQRGGYTPIEIPLDKRARLVLGHLLADIDGSIGDGFLPPVPEKDACKTCDYSIVCGPYEERRLFKKNRRDERLEPLIEIRGMI